jgi:hypothetical protein
MRSRRFGMRKVKDIPSLCKAHGRPTRQVARSGVLLAVQVVGVEHRAKAAGLDWRKAQQLEDAEIGRRLYGAPPRRARPGERRSTFAECTTKRRRA